MSIQNEVNEICEVLHRHLERKWDGKECILELKEADYQWKQMEWIGWYIEYKLRKLLTKRIGGDMNEQENLK